MSSLQQHGIPTTAYGQSVGTPRTQSLLPMPTAEIPRSFHRVGLVLGLSGGLLAAYFGACYIYRKFYARALPSVDPSSLSLKLTASKEKEEVLETYLAQTSEMPIDPSDPNFKVVLHQCPRGYFTPCIAPFSLKLETFLRIANIPYEVMVPNNRDF